ncbi:hypothetical protein ABPG75_002258 [Micractinium tetrahymenae]
MARLALACALLVALFAAPALARGPLIDYDCAKKCIVKYGWNPICVADGRTDTEGTLYANACTFKHCVTAAWLNDNTPRYNYLPLDCGSAVACSLMAHDVERCKQVWLGQTATSSTTDDACSCGLKRAPAKQCHEGRNGCLRCQDDKRCRACRLGYRLGAAGVCKPCAVEGCLRCPGSINYCTACDTAAGFRRTAAQKCVRA